jgi:hypothetical protein
VEPLVVVLMILAFKVPILLSCWYIYRIIHDVPQPEIESDGGEFVKAEFGQGPRRRGPHGGPPAHSASVRRADPGHDHAHEAQPVEDRSIAE